MGATGISLGYFFLMTKLMTFKARNFTDRLIREKQNVPSARRVMQLLNDHDEYLATLHMYNRYWSGYLAITMLELIPLMTTLAYLAFVIELKDKLFRFAFIFLFGEFVVMFTAIFMAGSRVGKGLLSSHDGSGLPKIRSSDKHEDLEVGFSV
ncbi:hypothetical protein HDE_03445 [Halotydeus destructor]|nr:hypothetical protein HDE_03445 [Halotydeus destructor]